MKYFGLKNVYYYIYFLSLAILLTLHILSEFDWLIYLLFALTGFGWTLFFFGKKLNVIEIILISPIIFATLFISYIIFFAFISIPVSLFIGIFFFIFSFVFFVRQKVFDKENVILKYQEGDLIALLIVVYAIGVKTLAVRDIPIPNLHDPITHAYLAKTIADTGFINFFYSPGLHILSAFSYLFNGENIARQILLITNIFSGYAGALVYIYIKRIVNDKISALIATFMFSFSISFAMFFSSAGKNSLVLGISFLIFFLFLLSQNYKGVKYIVISLLTLFVTFIVHYPTAVFASVYLAAYFLVNVKTQKKRSLIVGLGAVFGFIWMAKTWHFQPTGLPTDGQIPMLNLPANILKDLYSYIFALWSSRELAFRSLYSISSTIPIILSVTAIGGGIYICKKAIYSKRRGVFGVILLWTIISLLVGISIKVLSISSLDIVYETLTLLLFVYLYLFIALFTGEVYTFLTKILNKDFLYRLFVVFLVSIVSVVSLLTYNYFRRVSNQHVLEPSDVDVFTWINTNDIDEENILINAYAVGDIVFSSDAGGWLGVFTDHEISMPFYDYGSVETHTNLKIYNVLREDLQNCEALTYLDDNNIDYYYQGSKEVYGLYLSNIKTLQENGWEIVYLSGNSALFKIPDCD